MGLKWSERAISDMQAIFDQIVVDSPQNALLVDERISEQALGLVSFAGIGRNGRTKDTRELVIQRTPYIVVYREVESDVEVLAVVHGKQRWPGNF
jgi:toxin ParE1/3/4